MLNTTPLALSIGKSSSGEAIAAAAASWARLRPDPRPIPINAVPASPIIVRTSAKSTLMRPGLMMISEMPTTPCLSTSSATVKAFSRGVFSGIICSRRSLETIMSVSTVARRFSMAWMACCMRRLPSNPKGLVTTPTVSAPALRAISATIGAAPEPVPPPIPAVTKTKSEPCTSFRISCRLSSAAFRPLSGMPPAPRPRVTSLPMLSVSASSLNRDSACASVLTAANSTPSTPVLIILRTAFPPAPPTPMTFMTQGETPPSGSMPDLLGASLIVKPCDNLKLPGLTPIRKVDPHARRLSRRKPSIVASIYCAAL
mmetsp:Transcript_2579/g.5670  ORF Transcript_2579/g.5670 Transcript_2579/m.5670 type:complete len:314 (+) Transcript_2579:808-1749(+)